MTSAPLTAKELRSRINTPGWGCPVDVHTTGLLAEEIRRLTNADDELVSASAALLNKIDSITTEEFSKGAEREERETLRSVLAGIGQHESTDDA